MSVASSALFPSDSLCILVSGFYPLTAGSCRVADASLTHVPMLGVCNDHGKTYALYAITVIRKNPDGSEDTWKTYRRYSDFHDFHMRITEQVEYESDSAAPSGQTFLVSCCVYSDKKRSDGYYSRVDCFLITACPEVFLLYRNKVPTLIIFLLIEE